jgi:hypothetical protein
LSKFLVRHIFLSTNFLHIFTMAAATDTNQNPFTAHATLG